MLQIKDVLETIHSQKGEIKSIGRSEKLFVDAGRDELALRWTGLNTALVVMVQLCQRVSPRLDEVSSFIYLARTGGQLF